MSKKNSSSPSPKLPGFNARVKKVTAAHKAFLNRPNPVDRDWENGVFERFQHPVLTAHHVPLAWRYDFNPQTNPHFMERMGVGGAYNPGAFLWKGKPHLVARVEGADRKSFFAIAASKDGVSKFKFWDEPCDIPEIAGETNLYDMRVVFHEDGWIYGIFCAESKDPQAAPGDLSSAIAQAGIVRTKDFRQWERLPNLKTPSSQQRNVVLHPEWVNGQYAFYTRPMDGFIDVGSGGGIGWTLLKDIAKGRTGKETIWDYPQKVDSRHSGFSWIGFRSQSGRCSRLKNGGGAGCRRLRSIRTWPAWRGNDLGSYGGRCARS